MRRPRKTLLLFAHFGLAFLCAASALAAAFESRPAAGRPSPWPGAAARAMLWVKNAGIQDLKSPVLERLVAVDWTDKRNLPHLELMAEALGKRALEKTVSPDEFEALGPGELIGHLAPAAEAAGKEAERQALKVLNRFGPAEIPPPGLIDEAERVLLDNLPYLDRKTSLRLSAAMAVMKASPMKSRLEAERGRWTEAAPPFDSGGPAARGDSAGPVSANPFTPEGYRHPLSEVLKKHAPRLVYDAETGDSYSFNWTAEAAFQEFENGVKPALREIRSVGALGPWQRQQLDEARGQAAALVDFIERVWSKHKLGGEARWRRIYEGLRERINRVQTRIRSEERRRRERAAKSWNALESLREENDGRAVPYMLDVQAYYRWRLDRAWQTQYQDYFAQVNEEITRGQNGLPPIRVFHAAAHYVLSRPGNWAAQAAPLHIVLIGLFLSIAPNGPAIIARIAPSPWGGGLIAPPFNYPAISAAVFAASLSLLIWVLLRLRAMKRLRFELSALRRLRRPPGS